MKSLYGRKVSDLGDSIREKLKYIDSKKQNCEVRFIDVIHQAGIIGIRRGTSS